MFKRQSLLAIGPVRPACTRQAHLRVRIDGVRNKSEIPSANGERNSTPTNSSPPSRQPSPRNAPNTSSTAATHSRQQRATRISEEVRMLNRANPAVNRSGNNSSDPAARSRSPRPHDVRGQSPRSRTPRHTPSTRGGPSTQTATRHLTSEQAAATAALDAAPQDPERPDAEDGSPDEYMAPSTQHELVLLEQFDRQDITPVPFDPEPVTKDHYLKLGQGGATIAAGNYEGVLEDRLRLLAEPTQDGFRWAPDIASRLNKGSFVSFNDHDEKSQVLAAGRQRSMGAKFSQVSVKTRTAIFDKLVRGTYTPLNAAAHKQPVLNDIIRNTLRNSTYLEQDQTKLLKKIRSLLPSETAASAKSSQQKN